MEKGKNYVIIILAAIVAVFTYYYFNESDVTEDFIPRSKDLSDSLNAELSKNKEIQAKQLLIIDSLNREINKADSVIANTRKEYDSVKEKIMSSSDSVAYDIIINHIDSTE